MPAESVARLLVFWMFYGLPIWLGLLTILQVWILLRAGRKK